MLFDAGHHDSANSAERVQAVINAAGAMVTASTIGLRTGAGSTNYSAARERKSA